MSRVSMEKNGARKHARMWNSTMWSTNKTYSIFLPPAQHATHFSFWGAKVISSASGGQCDYFSPYSPDYTFIALASDGKQGGVVADAK